ncbi:MAG: hypothetical protein JXN61_14320 [Sedimentisphaerales bacterium]|nr:hypothetical protein [Sedimentisphaerales bacterium]
MSNLRDVPKPVQVAALLAGGGGVAAVAILAPRFAIALFIGLAVVAAALFLFRRTIKWRNQHRSAPMEEGVLRSGAPLLRKADEKVKIDNLRRRFEDGIDKFREAGKNFYSLPWFMIVGEPGSGKTEAIRHCNVGFPPGLQDEYQGVGGTINMNWWFTNYGVIIDTAGRLMFEDVEAGGTKEWREFLNLLKKYRPYCPINGVFLVIPADSLVKDTAEQIQQKASQIAQQFNVIQRTLAVRFPVFVVVTKCDLVMGFREFFDGLNNPELQHQMFGWSNPAMIDQPYNREFVRQHLQTVQDRLLRRRLSLLLELAGDDAAAHESASINALYSFPKSLAQLAPRMARYLDLIFGAGGEWGAKPVFFRGIYFTSSMQEGAALDEDLAQALGISVESLPEGPAWTRDRAYFLRDLFVKKVFPEKGLVSTAVNASKHYVRKRMVFWLSVAAAILLLLIYTIHAERRFEKTVGRVESHVAKAATAMKDNSLDMVEFPGRQNDRVYWDKETGVVDMKRQPVRRYQFYNDFQVVIDGWNKEMEKGGRWLLLPLRKLSNIDTAEMQLALKNIFEHGAIKNFYEETCELLASPPSVEDWTVSSSELRVLAQLIKLRSSRAALAPANPSDEYTANRFFDPFCDYWRARESRAGGDVSATLNAVFADLYVPTPTAPAAFAWPPPFLNEDSALNEVASQSITAAVGRFVKDCDPNNRGNTKALKNLFAVLQDFNNAEEELWKLKDRDIGSFRDAKDGWPVRFGALKKARDSIDNLLQNDPNLSGITTSLKSKYDELIKEGQGNALEAYDVLLKAFGYDDAQKGLPDQIAKAWSKADKPVEILVEGRKKWLELEKNDSQGKRAADLDRKLWGGKERLYQLRYQKYASVDGLDCTYDDPVSVHGDSGEKAADVITRDAKAVNNAIEKLKENRPTPGAYGFDEAEALCEYALNLAKDKRIDDVVEKALKSAAPDSAWLIGKIADKVTTAITYLNDWVTFGGYVGKGSTLRKGYDAKDEVYKGYIRDYWLGTYLKNWIGDNIPKENTWANQHGKLSQSDYSKARNDLKNLGDSVNGVVAAIFPEGSQDQTIKDFRESRDMLNKIGPDDPYRYVVAEWTGLTDTEQARGSAYAAQYALLNKSPRDFLDENFPARDPEVPPSRFVESYWWNLSFETLKVLAKEPPGLSPEAKVLLSPSVYYKYPIVPKAEYELTTAEFDKAKEVWENIRKGPVYKPGTIGTGLYTAIPDTLVTYLKDLKRIAESSQTPDEIKKIGGRIDYVSTIRTSYDLRLSVCAEGNEEIFKVLQYVELEGDNLTRAENRPRTDPPADAHLADMHWPGGPFKFDFYQGPADRTPEHSQPSPISGQWILMRVLDYAYPEQRGDGKWPRPIAYGGKQYQLTIVVKPVQTSRNSVILRP